MAGWPNLWIDLAAFAALCGTIAYALFGGADFGGGVWDLFAFGPRKKEQRLAIVRAIRRVLAGAQAPSPAIASAARH